MAEPNSKIRLSGVLEPLLNAAEGSDAEVEHAICLVAEALAALGVLVVDQHGRPVHGITDEQAVLGALNTYGRLLVSLGQLDDAIEVTQLMERIQRLQGIMARRPPRRDEWRQAG